MPVFRNREEDVVLDIAQPQLSRRLPEDRVSALIATGYNRAQIDAIALLAA